MCFKVGDVGNFMINLPVSESGIFKEDYINKSSRRRPSAVMQLIMEM